MRFSIVLIIGITLINVFYPMQFAFPIFDFWSFPLWIAVVGFAPCLVAGALTKDLGRGIVGGLIIVFLGPIISTLLLLSVSSALNFVIGGLGGRLWLSLWACLHAASGGALGAFLSKNALRIREFIVKRKRTTIVVIAVIWLIVMTPIAGVMLFAKISHERCDGLVQLLKDQYFYKVTEKPMHFREEAFEDGIRLVDCGGDNEKFLSELLSSEGVSKAYYFKPSTGAYVWFTEYTSVRDRLVYVRYGLWQFKPITHGFGFPLWWIFTVFVFPTLILIFVEAISAKTEETTETIVAPQLRPFPMEKYPEELALRYQSMYPHNPAGVLEFHISRKMKEGKTREQAIEELIKESG